MSEDIAASVWVISDSGVDRDDDIVAQLPSWDIDGYIDSGCPVLLDHGSSSALPIGSVKNPESGRPELWSEGGKTYARVYHNVKTQLGREVWELVKAGNLGNASIGFIPRKKHRRGVKEGMFSSASGGPWSVEELELIEISLTCTGSNPRARMISRTKSQGGRRLPYFIKSAAAQGIMLERWNTMSESEYRTIVTSNFPFLGGL